MTKIRKSGAAGGKAAACAKTPQGVAFCETSRPIYVAMAAVIGSATAGCAPWWNAKAHTSKSAALWDVDLLPNRGHCFALGLWAQGFPLTTTFNPFISSMASASSFFSRAFPVLRTFGDLMLFTYLNSFIILTIIIAAFNIKIVRKLIYL